MHKFTHLISLSLISFGVGVGVGGCGPDTTSHSTSGGSTSPPTIEELPGLVVAEQCKDAAKCNAFESVAVCESTVDVDISDIKAGVDSGTIKYNADKVQACIDALPTNISCSHTEQAQSPQIQDTPAACQQVFVGTIADKAACKIDEECVSQNCEVADPASCMSSCCAKVCAPKPTPVAAVKVGGSCADAGSFCESGAYCQHDAMFNPTTCAAQAASGAACTDFSGCKDPAYCNLDPMTNMGTCMLPAAHGAACDVNLFSLACDLYDDYCDATTKVCTSKKPVGDACSTEIPCVGFAYCDAKSMKCVKQGTEGAACDVMIDAKLCAGSLSCVAGKCAFDVPPMCP